MHKVLIFAIAAVLIYILVYWVVEIVELSGHA